MKLVSLFRREGGDDFFEARIAAERIPKGIESKIGWRDPSGHFEEVRQCGDRRVMIAKARLNLRECSLSPRLVYCIVVVVFDRPLRLLERLFLFSKPGVGESKSVRCSIRVWRNRRIRFRFNRFDRPRKTSTRILIPPCPLLTKTKLHQGEFGNTVERLSRGN